MPRTGRVSPRGGTCGPDTLLAVAADRSPKDHTGKPPTSEGNRQLDGETIEFPIATIDVREEKKQKLTLSSRSISALFASAREKLAVRPTSRASFTISQVQNSCRV